MYTTTVIITQRSGLGIKVRNEVKSLAETAISLQDLKGKLEAAFPKLKAGNGRNASEYYKVKISKEWTIHETLEVEYEKSKMELIVIIVYKK